MCSLHEKNMDPTNPGYLSSFEQLVQQNFVLKQLFSVIRKSPRRKGVLGFLLCLFCCMPEVLLTLFLSHLLKNNDLLMKNLKSLTSFLYKKLLFKPRLIEDKNQQVLKLMNETADSLAEDTLFPKHYITVLPNNTKVLNSLYFKKSDFDVGFTYRYNQLQKTLDNKCEFFLANPATNKYSHKVPMLLYPSNNYLKLANTIDKSIKLSKTIKNYSVKGILINGEPGLGKSYFSDFFTEYTQQCKRVLKIDLTSFINQPLKDIIKSFVHLTDCPILYMLDELDKYVKFHSEYRYKIHREEHLASQKDGIFTKELQDPSDFIKDLKTEILLTILSVLESTNSLYPSCIIFCSNNFHTIFEGTDKTHFESLTTRFTVHDFFRCDAEEFKNYCRFYNNLCKDETEFFCDNLEEVLQNVPSDTSLTFRELEALRFSKNCIYKDMVDTLIEGPDNLLFKLI